MDLVDHQQGAARPRLREVERRGGGDRLIGGDIAGEPAGGIAFVVGRPNAQGMSEGGPPERIGERLLGL